MVTDVVDLRDFYNSSLGKMTSAHIFQSIARLWPTLEGHRLLGLGYPLPYLDPYLDQAERVIAMMPAQQGIITWPTEGPSLCSLIEEDEFPLPDQSVDRILLVHALEHTSQIRSFLREVWRVLDSNGRLMIVVPNRRGIWARLDHTPFGHGQPYTMTQLSNLLRENMFTPLASTRGLYSLPSSSRLMLTAGGVMEKIGKKSLQKFSGVICIEAVKQVYAGTPVRSRRKFQLPVLAGIRKTLPS